jgi:DNA-binding transcriptional LysR family regulator
MNWDDIKIFLEVARTERLTEAAKRLGLDASTVSRRLHKLEENLATKLFERTVDGHVLTSDGKQLLNSARQMEQNAQSALATIKNNNKQNSGCVRIGATEAFGSFFIAPHIITLQQQYPNIQVELLQFARFVKISRNEADIAITVEKPKSTSMIVTKLCDYKLQLYASRHYLENISQPITPLQLNHQQWVSYVDNLLFSDQLAYLKDILATQINQPVTPAFSSTSIISQYNAIKSGLGIGILPCFLAEQDRSLEKLCAPEISIIRSFYLVTHPESKRLSHVSTVWQYLKQLTQTKRNLLMPN